MKSLKEFSYTKTKDAEDPKSKSSIFLKSPLSSLEDRANQAVRLTKEDWRHQMRQVTENENETQELIEESKIDQNTEGVRFENSAV